MLDLFQIGKGTKRGNVNDGCQGLMPVVRLVKTGLIPIVQLGIPIILVVLGTIDLGKAVIASNEEAIKKAQGMLVKRAIYAVAIFFIVTIVTVLMGIVAKGTKGTGSDTDSWGTCWDKA
ncbi:MAG: hypothetical protein IJF92_04020 [Bacilli bacterium]|nr:hypothetical protein [Bacilli bacterium]